MNQMLPRPQFWDDAAEQDQTRFTMFGELTVFWLLFLVAAFGQSFLLSFFLVSWILGFQGEAYYANLRMSSAELERLVNELLYDAPDWAVLCDCFAYVTLGMVAILYCRRAQRRSFSSMGLRGSFLPEYALGAIVGALLFFGVLGLGSWAQVYQVRMIVGSRRQWLLVIFGFFGCVVRGASVVLLVQGYLAPSIAKRYPALAALCVSALAATMLQSSLLSLQGINSLLIGLLLGVWTLKRGSLWGACALYSTWLFANNFLCSFASAGEHRGIYLIAVEADSFRSTLTGAQSNLLTGQSDALRAPLIDPQAGICATVVLLAALMLALALRAKDPAPPKAPQDELDANIL